MAGAEQPQRLHPDHRVSVDDVRRLIAGLPGDDPARVMGEREIARLEQIAFTGETRGEHEEPLRPLPSLNDHAVPRRVAD
jgi:hypothetical protein